MSPRSEELLNAARERLRDAEQLVADRRFTGTVSLAYYASLYAARAALSEANANARTHRGTWDLFRTTFVDSGRFDSALLVEVRRSQGLREEADYAALQIDAQTAASEVELARRFVAAVERLLG